MMTPRRFGIVISSMAVGGAERTVANLCGELLARGYEVSLAVLGGEPEVPIQLPVGVRVRFLRRVRPSRFGAEAVVQNVGRLVAIRGWLREERPERVIAMTTQIAVLTVLAASGTTTPVYPAERNFPPANRPTIAWRVLRRVAYRYAAAILVQTERAAAWARSEFPSRRVAIVPNPVSESFFQLREGEAGPSRVIAVVGRLAEVKRPEFALEVFALIATDDPVWELWFVGDGELRDRLDQRVRELRLGSRVRFLGVRSDMAAVYASAEVVLLTSRSEGFPNVLLEGMASGCVIAACDVEAGPREIIGDNERGVLLPSVGSMQVAAKLSALLSDAGRRQQCRASAYAFVERHRPHAAVEQWLMAIEAA